MEIMNYLWNLLKHKDCQHVLKHEITLEDTVVLCLPTPANPAAPLTRISFHGKLVLAIAYAWMAALL